MPKTGTLARFDYFDISYATAFIKINLNSRLYLPSLEKYMKLVPSLSAELKS